MIPYGHQSIDERDVRRVIKVLNSDWLTQGPDIEIFEKRLAEYCEARYAAVVSNGTAALHLAYLASGIKPGDEVITTPNTFVATTNMLLTVGAKPVFCDIRADTLNIDETKIDKLITGKTKAIVPVHFAGHPCEMDTIYKIAKKHKLVVIDDACHALGATYKGKKIGSLESDFVVFSFHPVKAIATGEGGAVISKSKKLMENIRLLRSHGVTKDGNGFNVMTGFGYNYRLTDIQASLGISQLGRINNFLRKRHRVVSGYSRALKDCKEIILPVELSGNYSGWHIYVIRTVDPKKRLPLMKFLKSKNIGVNFHYPAVYSHPYYRRLGYTNLHLPNADLYHSTGITLPCYPDLTESQTDYISRSIKDFFRNGK